MPPSGPPIPTRVGRYEIAYEIASGGMASVYLARALGAAGFEKVVAIKVIHPHLAKESAFVEMFLDEARLAARIQHPNVCQVFDFGEADGTYFMAMEYLLGEPLSRVLRRTRKRSKPEARQGLPRLAVKIIAEAAEGLHAAHEIKDDEGRLLELVHRDVSPQNIFVTFDGTVKIVDFGVARARERVHHTETGQIKGKLAYASPEQLRAQAIDRRTDIFALGICLWEFLTLERLFHRESQAATMMAVVTDPIEAPSKVAPWVPPELDAIVLRALERDPAARYQTARAFSSDLRRWLSSSASPVLPEDLEAMMDFLFADAKQERQDVVRKVRSGVISMPKPLVLQSEGSASTASQVASLPDAGGSGADASAAHVGSPEPSKRARRGGRAWLVGFAGLLGLVVAGFVGWEQGVFQRGRGPQPSDSGALEPATHGPSPNVDARPAEDRAGGPQPRPMEEQVQRADAPLPREEAQMPERTATKPRREPNAGATSSVPDASKPQPVAEKAPPPGSQTRGTRERVRKPKGRRRNHTGQRAATKSSKRSKEEDLVLLGRVAILAEPGWATVLVDGKRRGKTPLRLSLPEGVHAVRLLPFGKEPGINRSVEAVAGADAVLRVHVERVR